MMQEINKNTFPQLYDSSLYERILSLLGTGRGAGIHVRDICKVTGLDDRAVRKAIETIRRAGVVICTNGLDGYFYPESMEELRLYIRQEERRGRSTFYTLKAARRLYQKQSKEHECE
ncbi:MAG: hypothetical protein IJZ16_10270 [Clostridia bacterium]|nr:hypothetical protein [Clostridia bacterium]